MTKANLALFLLVAPLVAWLTAGAWANRHWSVADRCRHVIANLADQTGDLLVAPSRVDGRLEELEKEKQTNLTKARDLAAKAEAENRDFTPEERTQVKEAVAAAKAAHDQIMEAKGDDALIEQINVLGQPLGTLATGGGVTPAPGKFLTLGQRFTEAPEWKAWIKANTLTDSIPDTRKGLNSPPVAFRGVKDILAGGDDAGGGALVQNDFQGLVDLGTFQRPLTVRDLVTAGITGSDTVEYARVTGWTNAAAPVAEARGTSGGLEVGDVTGSKPESAVTLERVTAPVRTVAHWLPATKRALSDAGQVRTLIDNFLRYGLEEELEDQIVNGTGAGESFEGLLNVPGTQVQAWDTNLLTTLRKAKTKVRTVGRARASAYLLNPNDNERIDLLTNLNGDFYFGAPTGDQDQRVWALPRVESEAVPEGTGLVGDFRMAVLWDREQAAIQVSDSHNDFFVRNLIAILAEMRAAFGVLRPAAFVEIDLTAA